MFNILVAFWIYCICGHHTKRSHFRCLVLKSGSKHKSETLSHVRPVHILVTHHTHTPTHIYIYIYIHTYIYIYLFIYTGCAKNVNTFKIITLAICSRTFAQNTALSKWMLASPRDRQDSQRKRRKHGCRSRSARSNINTVFSFLKMCIHFWHPLCMYTYIYIYIYVYIYIYIYICQTQSEHLSGIGSTSYWGIMVRFQAGRRDASLLQSFQTG
jgi:hypothetical protein